MTKTAQDFSSKFAVQYDGVVWRAQLKGGNGRVFAETESLALNRAQAWTWTHKRVWKNNESGVHSYAGQP